ncbi:hypothetical protein [Pseudomonas sp. 2FE]|nr:hypothetical protein [Pseudomonas sp. 2FE]
MTSDDGDTTQHYLLPDELYRTDSGCLNGCIHRRLAADTRPPAGSV